ncbi:MULTISPECIES: transposase [Streptomyces violaceusniger group]|uniref:transposase n=1 Tax=Streptomyces violaceusniger group TaxID=2839105 RepID=UPI001FC97A6B|nr:MULTISPECIES: transposase [Streptomyces violaceusniger group]
MPVQQVLEGAVEKRTHDYVRHGATNLFAALNVTTGEVLSECKSNRNGASFLAFLEKAIKAHAGTQIHVVLDNLSTYKPMRRNESTTTRVNTIGMRDTEPFPTSVSAGQMEAEDGLDGAGDPGR